MSALQLLLLEPNLLDAQTVQATLSSGGIDCQLLRVGTRADFVEALETNRFDLILSDYSVPGFEGSTALEIARQQQPETPFVFVSASVGEELAIAALEAGAAGFVLKHRLERLVPCMERIVRENSRYTSTEAVLREEGESNGAAVAEARAGATLRDAEARLRAVAANLPQGAVFVVDRDLRYLLAEGKALKEAGTTSEDLVGKTIWEALDPALANYYEPYFRQGLKGEPFSHEHYSHDRHYISHGTPLVNEQGEVYAVLAMSYDITDRKRAEATLRQREAELARVQKIGRVAGIDIDLAAGMTTDLAAGMTTDLRSPEYVCLHGLSSDTNSETHADWLGRLHPNDRDHANRVLMKAIAGNSLIYENEYRIVRPIDGEVRWIYARSDIERDETGRALRLVGAHIDITDRKRGEDERKQVEDALRVSEARYRLLFTSIDEAYAVVEPLKNDRGEWSDFRFIEVNPAFVAQTGMEYPVGRLATDLLEAPNPRWAQVWGQVAETGEPIRFEESEAELGRTFDLYAFRLHGDRTVGVIFQDITARKQQEQRQAFLLKLSDALRPLFDATEIQRTAMHVLGEHLALDRAMYAEITPDGETVIVNDNYLSERFPPFIGEFPLSAYGSIINKLRVGERVVVADVDAETELTEAEKTNYKVIGATAFVTIPLIKGGRWVSNLAVHQGEPRRWTTADIAIFQEAAERTWAAVERARAEAALRQSESKYRSLFESIDEGFAIFEMIYDAAGLPADYLTVEVNPSFQQQTGVEPSIIGKRVLEVFPDLDRRWIETYGRVALTGESVRFEEYAVNRWFDVHASRLGGRGSRQVAAIFQDITDRKLNERRQAFLLKLSDALRSLSDAREIQRTAMRVLGEHLALDRAMYAEITPDGETVIVNDNYLSERFPALIGEFPLSTYGSIINKLRDGEPLMVADVDAETELSEMEKTNYKEIGAIAFVTLPLIKDGRWVSNLGVHQGEPRQWTTEEIALLQETAERTWAAVERARAEAALRESEERYRGVVNQSIAGVAETDLTGKFTLVNDRYCEITGYTRAELLDGMRMQDLTHIEDLPENQQQFEQLVRNGIAFEIEKRYVHKDGVEVWVSNSVFAVVSANGERQSLVAIVLDITDRKRRELNTALLDEASNALANLSTPDEIMQTVGARVGECLHLSSCVFVDVDEAQGKLTVHHSWTIEDVPSLKQTFRLQDYLTEEFSRACRAGETVIVSDTGHDDRTDAENYARLQVGSFVVVPFHWQGRWTAYFAVTSVEPRDWQTDEIDLLQEISNRLFPRIERARAEETIAADLRDTQLLRELGVRLVTEGDVQTLYQEILSVAIALTHSDAGSVQILDDATQDLLLLATQGLDHTMTDHFYRINVSSNTPCGIALRTGERSFADFDVLASQDPDDSLRVFVEGGLLSAQSTPLITRSGRVIGIVSTHWRDHHRPTERELRFLDLLARQATDLIEQRQFEQALRQSESRFRFIVESAKDYAIFTLNLNGIVTSWNTGAERVLGYAEAEIVGRHSRIIFTPEDNEQGKAEQEMHLALTQGRAENERWHVRQDGSRFWGSGLMMRLQDEAGTTQGLVKIFQDKTAERQNAADREQLLQQEQAARAEADRANRVKDEFLAVLSHELRSPLNPILGWTQLLKRGNLDAARQREGLDTIERNARLQTQLIEDLLDISRIMQGKLSLTAAPINLTSVITAAVETVRLAAEAKQIQILLDLTPEAVPISGDMARLQQVVWNLLTNAVKFTPKGGRVTVELRQTEKWAQIRVIDTGKGIDAEFLPYVFDHFCQADASTTRKFGGLGLGLAIVQQIVEGHGGTVQAASSGEDQGATFTVQLPLIQQGVPTSSEPSQPSAENLEASLSNLKILVVDDEADTREFQSFLLEQSGARVIAVASGLEALQVLDQFIPDILVSDVGMAEMDGHMLIQHIRSRPPQQGGTIPAIAVTAYARDFDQQKALQVGFQAHITKPIEPDVLIETITNLLEPNNL